MGHFVFFPFLRSAQRLGACGCRGLTALPVSPPRRRIYGAGHRQRGPASPACRCGRIGEKVHLLKVVLSGLFGADTHQPHGALRPHLAHQLDCHMVEAVRGVRRVGQRRLVARAAEGVVHQLYRDDTGRLAVGAQTPPDGIAEVPASWRRRPRGGPGPWASLRCCRSCCRGCAAWSRGRPRGHWRSSTAYRRGCRTA